MFRVPFPLYHSVGHSVLTGLSVCCFRNDVITMRFTGKLVAHYPLGAQGAALFRGDDSAGDEEMRLGALK